MGFFKIALCSLLILIGFSASALVPQIMSLPDEVGRKLKSFEPSAALYLADLDLFLITSDDTTAKDDPLLFLMNEKGQIENPAIKIKGIDKMTDMESLSQDENGTLYVLSSQGLNKDGKDKDERNVFLRATRNGKNIKAEDSISLRPLLLKAFKKSDEPELKGMRSRFKNELDIESHFVRAGDLYVGLKEPQPQPGTAVILKAGNVDALFGENHLNLSVWKTINFSAVTGEQDLLSDILPIANKLMLTTTQESGASRLWDYDEESGELTLVQEFADLRSEGLAFHPAHNSLLVVFDQGLEDAYFAFGPLSKFGLQNRK